jgi:hypothetical protein
MFLIVAMTEIKQKLRIAREHHFRSIGSMRVPQIWLTYDELAAWMNCDRAEARTAAMAIGLDRRKSRDGQTRAKLTPPLAKVFLDNILRQYLEQEMACAGDLRAMRERMEMRSTAMPPFRSVIAG